MGLFDRIKTAVTGSARRDAAMRIEGDRMVFTNADEARKRLPLQPGQVGKSSLDACESCGGTLRRFVFTTAGGGDQVAVWRAYPLAVDGWVCPSCGWAAAPRRVSAEEIMEFIRTGVTHAQEGRLDDAEYWFLRATTSWPNYPHALANLAQVYLQRARAQGVDRGALRRRAIGLLRDAAKE